jgi:hypothetical protein
LRSESKVVSEFVEGIIGLGMPELPFEFKQGWAAIHPARQLRW